MSLRPGIESGAQCIRGMHTTSHTRLTFFFIAHTIIVLIFLPSECLFSFTTVFSRWEHLVNVFICRLDRNDWCEKMRLKALEGSIPSISFPCFWTTLLIPFHVSQPSARPLCSLYSPKWVNCQSLGFAARKQSDLADSLAPSQPSMVCILQTLDQVCYIFSHLF